MRSELSGRSLVLALVAVLMGPTALAQDSAAPPPESGRAPTEATKNEPAPGAGEPQDAGEGTNRPSDLRGGQGHPTPNQIVGPPNAGAVPLRGDAAETLPGATRETVPAKFSEENARRDEFQIMEIPAVLTDEQRRHIWQALGNRQDTPGTADVTLHAEPSVLLPGSVEAQELPTQITETIPAVRGYKYVKADGKVLLVAPANGIVRAVIEEPSQTGAAQQTK